jgi:methylthioribose-1-phosphate isomerase
MKAIVAIGVLVVLAIAFSVSAAYCDETINLNTLTDQQLINELQRRMDDSKKQLEHSRMTAAELATRLSALQQQVINVPRAKIVAGETTDIVVDKTKDAALYAADKATNAYGWVKGKIFK